VDFAEQVLAVVERIPRGKVMSYGDIAEYLGSSAPRAVGKVMAQESYDGVPWHRVLRSNGTPAEHLTTRQLALLEAEGVPIRNGRVVMRLARWDGRS
jgi:methylated-DNA-protein-cysteine methyltransferase related protein